MLLALGGPTVTGKTSIASYLINNQGFVHLPPVTTRPLRRNEVNGLDYYFIEDSTFQALIQNNSLIFWDQLFGNKYGISREMDHFVATYPKVIVTVPVWRLDDLFQRYRDVVGIHLLAPSGEEVRRRLISRGSLNIHEIEERVNEAMRQNSFYIPMVHRMAPVSLDDVRTEILHIIATA